VHWATIRLSDTPKVVIAAVIVGSGTIDLPYTVWSENTDWYPTDNSMMTSIQH
jgi:hypothetical protein